jgi:hypothetical protein
MVQRVHKLLLCSVLCLITRVSQCPISLRAEHPIVFRNHTQTFAKVIASDEFKVTIWWTREVDINFPFLALDYCTVAARLCLGVLYGARL